MKHSPEFGSALAWTLVNVAWLIINAALIVPVMVTLGGDLMVIGVLVLMLCHAYLLSSHIRHAIRIYRKPLQRK